MVGLAYNSLTVSDGDHFSFFAGHLYFYSCLLVIFNWVTCFFFSV